jgi:hypothetical protein
MDSEDPYLMPMDGTPTESVFLVMSHVFIALAMLNALYRRLFYVTASTAILLWNSTLFHMCRANWTCGMFGTPLLYDSSSPALYRSRVADHSSANHGVVSMIFAMLTSDPAGGPTVGALRLILLAGTIVAEMAYPLKTMALIVAVGWLMGVMASYTWLSIKGQLPTEDRFDLGLLSLALVAIGAGYLFFELTTMLYGISHSLWHVFIGLAIFLVTEGIHKGRGGRSWIRWPECKRPAPVMEHEMVRINS